MANDNEEPKKAAAAEVALKPNIDESIGFMRGWQPDGPWNLVAITPDGLVSAHTFQISEEKQARDWIEKRQFKANVYFHVNELSPATTHRKAKKSDVVLAVGLHVDIDDLSALPRLQSFVPRPTVITSTGGGFHGFWRLPTPNPDLDAVEALNAAIAKLLGGDKCQNIDRLMRLVGTINVPNKKKRESGRTDSLAHVVEADWGLDYPLEQFEFLRAPRSKALANTSPAPAKATACDLPDGIGEYTRALIMSGDDPERPRGAHNARYKSRSEAVYRAVCDLVRLGCTDELILNIVQNPDFGISASVLEKARPGDYAARQVASAREKCGDDWPDVTANKRPRSTYANVLLSLRRMELSTTYDSFHKRLFISGHALQAYQGELTDHAAAHLRHVILGTYGFDPGRDHVRDALHALCLENQFHPVLTYLGHLTWDGVERLPGFFADYCGADDTPLNRAMSQIIFVAAVKRIRRPGTKFDTIAVLEGRQGTGKSTLLEILAGAANFSDQNILALDSKAQMEALEGVWIFELSELEGMTKADTAKMKAFASRNEDRNRPAYARFREIHPRETIFIGTTNDDQYLTDQTGNRRFWPIRTGQIDLDAVRRDRDQLWAEAAAKEARGASILLPKDFWMAAAHEQDLRMVDDGWLDLLSTVKGEKHGNVFRVSSAYLLTDVLRISRDKITAAMGKRVIGLMRRLGWIGPKLLRFAGAGLKRGYERPADQRELKFPTTTT